MSWCTIWRNTLAKEGSDPALFFYDGQVFTQSVLEIQHRKPRKWGWVNGHWLLEAEWGEPPSDARHLASGCFNAADDMYMHWEQLVLMQATWNGRFHHWKQTWGSMMFNCWDEAWTEYRPRYPITHGEGTQRSGSVFCPQSRQKTPIRDIFASISPNNCKDNHTLQ